MSKQLWEVTPDGRMVWHFHEGQKRVMRSEKRFVLMLAGSQGGKTSMGSAWLWREIKRRGPGDYLGVTSTFPLLDKKMLPEFQRTFEETLGLGDLKGTKGLFVFSQAGEVKAFGKPQNEKTRIIFGSATHPESLESATAKAAWIDECGQDTFKLASWEAIQRRLMLHQGRVLGTTTPYNLGWLKIEWYDRWLAGNPDIEVVQFESILNPAYPEEEYERLKRIWPSWKFKMYLQGQFERPPGLIYSDYIDQYREDGGHLVKPFAIPPEWPRYVGLDFGAVNTALLWAARDPAANVFYLYRESLEGGKTTPEHVAAAKAVAEGTNVLQWFGGSKSETQQRMDWLAAGIRVQEPPISDVESGIDRAIGLFKTMRLFIFDTCKGLRDELGTYSRELDDMAQPTDKIKDKESFHRADALRYLSIGLTKPRGVFGA